MAMRRLGFPYSDYQRSLRVAAAALCVGVGVAAVGMSLSYLPLILRLPGLSWIVAGLCLFSAVTGIVTWRAIDGSRADFVRLEPEFLSVDRALLPRWTVRWSDIYAAETPDPYRLVLRLSQRRVRVVELTYLEREDRPKFVQQLREQVRRAG